MRIGGFLLALAVCAPAFSKQKERTEEVWPLTITVIQSKQVPYTVQGGRWGNLNCNILNGTLNCNSYSGQYRWRHVASVLQVRATDGNTYVLACDAAFRWSKCRALLPGAYPARWSKGGLAVKAYKLGKKPKEVTVTYHVLRATAATSQ